MKTSFEQHDLNEMRKDPNHYKWGIFYFNPKDSRFIVPKRLIGFGWTLNFAHPFSYLLILVFILIVILVENLG